MRTVRQERQLEDRGRQLPSLRVRRAEWRILACSQAVRHPDAEADLEAGREGPDHRASVGRNCPRSRNWPLPWATTQYVSATTPRAVLGDAAHVVDHDVPQLGDQRDKTGPHQGPALTRVFTHHSRPRRPASSAPDQRHGRAPPARRHVRAALRGRPAGARLVRDYGEPVLAALGEGEVVVHLVRRAEFALQFSTQIHATPVKV